MGGWKVGTMLVGLLGVLWTHAPAGGKMENPAQSLSGVRAVHVMVHYAGPREARYGLSDRQIQHAVELCLSANDVRVVSDGDWRRQPGEPYLYVNVLGMQLEENGKKLPTFFYTFSIDFIQKVLLARRPNRRVDGCTWTEGYTAVLPEGELRTVPLEVNSLVYEFVKALKSGPTAVSRHDRAGPSPRSNDHTQGQD